MEKLIKAGPAGRYVVNLWGSYPGLNDDCWTGAEFPTYHEARRVYGSGADIERVFMGCGPVLRDTAWIEFSWENIEGGRVISRGTSKRPNPHFRPTEVDFREMERQLIELRQERAEILTIARAAQAPAEVPGLYRTVAHRRLKALGSIVDKLIANN